MLIKIKIHDYDDEDIDDDDYNIFKRNLPSCFADFCV